MVTRFQPIVPGTVATNVIVDRYSADANYLERILPHEQRGVIVDADAEDLWMRVDDVYQLCIALCGRHMRIDRDVRKETFAR